MEETERRIAIAVRDREGEGEGERSCLVLPPFRVWSSPPPGRGSDELRACVRTAAQFGARATD